MGDLPATTLAPKMATEIINTGDAGLRNHHFLTVLSDSALLERGELHLHTDEVGSLNLPSPTMHSLRRFPEKKAFLSGISNVR